MKKTFFASLAYTVVIAVSPARRQNAAPDTHGAQPTGAPRKACSSRLENLVLSRARFLSSAFLWDLAKSLKPSAITRARSSVERPGFGRDEFDRLAARRREASLRCYRRAGRSSPQRTAWKPSAANFSVELPGQHVEMSYENNTVFLHGRVKDLVSAERAVSIAATLGRTVNLLYVDVPRRSRRSFSRSGSPR